MGQAQLTEVLRHIPKSDHPDLLVGLESGDDAGIFRLPDGTALVQTVDFFTPVVDDPYAFGQIAAANALSDVYAMGGRPATVLNIACFDPDQVPPLVWAQVLKGGYDKCREAGAVVVGGHSVKDAEPKFGLAVTGIVDPDHKFVNSSAQIGDEIYLSKPLGSGIACTAAKSDQCPESTLTQAIATMAQLNDFACEAGRNAEVACATDITGFGLLGHLRNVCAASGVRIEVDAGSLPLIEGVLELVAGGFVTGGGASNFEYVQPVLETERPPNDPYLQVAVDPQTSGGLALFSRGQLPFQRIGRVIPGPAGILFR